MTRLDRIELAASSEVSDQLALDLGVDDDLAAVIRETDGVDAETSPVTAERIAVRERLAEPGIGLLLDRDITRSDLADHLSHVANLQTSLVFIDAELVQFAGDIKKQRVNADSDLAFDEEIGLMNLPRYRESDRDAVVVSSQKGRTMPSNTSGV